jgi:putative Ca2+/H+ antiporter (TMEM165/GDT1 family)
MDLITVFFSTFLIVGIGELGDKTQIASGIGALANRSNVKIIFFSSALALMSVAGITTLFAGFIPDDYLPKIIKAGGFLLIIYGIYLFAKASENDGEIIQELIVGADAKKLFITHFTVVFMAELGDKTQIATLAIAIDNQAELFTVFVASASALVFITAITVWGITKIPLDWINPIQKLGSMLMMGYGVHMIM